MVSQGCLFAVSWVFLKSFKEVLRVLGKMSRVFQGSFKSVSKKFQGNVNGFKKVPRMFK